MRARRATQARGDERRRALLEAALRVVGHGGLAALSHRAVAVEAGVPAGSTTYYFATKDDMVTETLRFAAEREVEALERRTRELEGEFASPEDLVDQVALWLDDQLRGESRTRLIALYALQLEAMRVPRLRPLYASWTVAAVKLAARLLEAAGVEEATARAPALVAAVDGVRHNQLASQDAGLSPAGRAVIEQVLSASRGSAPERPAA